MIKVTSSRKILLKGDRYFLGVGIATTLQTLAFLLILIFLIPLKLSAWQIACFLIILGLMACGAVESYLLYSKKVVLSDDGVDYRSLFNPKSRLWSDVRDSD
ncbi:MAG: hypothetical protein ACI3YK_05540 [Eubacteriales bacterium]